MRSSSLGTNAGTVANSLARVTSAQRQSRYHTDYEEIAFLGAGGFGSVVKCRARLAGGTTGDLYYAVKKIVTDDDEESNKWVLREASNLARLHHKHIVRYYSAWIEVDSQQQNGLAEKPLPVTLREVDGDTKCRWNESRRLPKILPSTSTPHFITSATGLPQPVSASNLQRSLSRSCLPRHRFPLEIFDVQGPNTDSSHGNSPSDGMSIMPEDLREFLRLQMEAMPDLLSGGSSEDSSSSSQEISEAIESGDNGELMSDSSESIAFDRRSADMASPSSLASFIPRVPSKDMRTPQRKEILPPIKSHTKGILYIVMEHVEGMTLRDAIQSGLLHKDKDLLWSICRELSDALAYMHSLNFVHRDLKPENVFLRRSSTPDEVPWHVKIGDLGLTTCVGTTTRAQKTPANNPVNRGESGQPLSVGVGTQFYIAPEVEAADGRYDQAADVYALGVMLFEMLSPPCKTSMERYKLLTALCKSQGAEAMNLGITDKMALTLINSLMSADPSKRMTARQVRQTLSCSLGSSSLDLINKIAQAPFSYEMLKLLTLLFNRTETATRAQTFWDKSPPASRLETRITTEIKAYFHGLFRTFNGLQVDLPLLRPARTNSKSPFRLLDPSGMALELPTCLLPLLKETLGGFHQASVIRRFSIQPIFTSRESEEEHLNEKTHPEASLQVAFDTLVNFDKINTLDRFGEDQQIDSFRREALFETEVLRLLCIVINAFQMWLGEARIVVSYTRILPLLLHHLLKIPEQHIEVFADLVRCPKYDRHIFTKRFRAMQHDEEDLGRADLMNADQAAKELEPWLNFAGDIDAFLARCEATLDLTPNPLDPLTEEMLTLLEKLRVLSRSMEACLNAVSRRFDFQVGVGFDKGIFDSKTGFIFGCYIPRSGSSPLVAGDDSMAGCSVACNPMTQTAKGPIYNAGNLIAVGGRMESEGSTVGSGAVTSFGLQIDLQSIINAILLAVAVNRLNYRKWKTSWRNSWLEKERSDRHTEGGSNTRRLSKEDDLVEAPPRRKHAASDTLSQTGALQIEGLQESSRPCTSLSKPFLLLPASTPLDAIDWFETIIGLNNLRSSNSPVTTDVDPAHAEVDKMKSNWKQAQEIAFAPAILRRFNPMLQTGDGARTLHQSDKLPYMVVIYIQSTTQLAAAYSIKAQLCHLKIKTHVVKQEVADVAKAKRRLRPDDICDWILFLRAKGTRSQVASSGALTNRVGNELTSPMDGSGTMPSMASVVATPIAGSELCSSVMSRSSTVARYRLVPMEAHSYLRETDIKFQRMAASVAAADRWFDDASAVIAQLVEFYIELLGAMSPSLGHLFARQTVE